MRRRAETSPATAMRASARDFEYRDERGDVPRARCLRDA